MSSCDLSTGEICRSARQLASCWPTRDILVRERMLGGGGGQAETVMVNMIIMNKEQLNMADVWGENCCDWLCCLWWTLQWLVLLFLVNIAVTGCVGCGENCCDWLSWLWWKIVVTGCVGCSENCSDWLSCNSVVCGETFSNWLSCLGWKVQCLVELFVVKIAVTGWVG